MASKKKITLKNGQFSYIVRYRDPSGKSVDERFRRSIDADNRKNEVEVDKQRGTWADPRRGRITLTDHIDQWHASRHHLLALDSCSRRISHTPAGCTTPRRSKNRYIGASRHPSLGRGSC